ncbi:MAG: hypothetical protein WA140_01165 [Geobacteraceae bacterium]
MLIRVIYKENVYDYVKDFQLDRFLDSGKVIKFQRRTGWVNVGIDPVRTGGNKAFSGAEKRGGRESLEYAQS